MVPQKTLAQPNTLQCPSSRPLCQSSRLPPTSLLFSASRVLSERGFSFISPSARRLSEAFVAFPTYGDRTQRKVTDLNDIGVAEELPPLPTPTDVVALIRGGNAIEDDMAKECHLLEQVSLRCASDLTDIKEVRYVREYRYI